MVYFRLKNIDYTFEIQISNLKDFVFKRIEWNPLPNRSALELKNPNLDVVIQSIIFYTITPGKQILFKNYCRRKHSVSFFSTWRFVDGLFNTG